MLLSCYNAVCCNIHRFQLVNSTRRLQKRTVELPVQISYKVGADIYYIEITQSNQNLIRETYDLPKNLNDRKTILFVCVKNRSATLA